MNSLLDVMASLGVLLVVKFIVAMPVGLLVLLAGGDSDTATKFGVFTGNLFGATACIAALVYRVVV